MQGSSSGKVQMLLYVVVDQRCINSSSSSLCDSGTPEAGNSNAVSLLDEQGVAREDCTEFSGYLQLLPLSLATQLAHGGPRSSHCSAR